MGERTWSESTFALRNGLGPNVQAAQFNMADFGKCRNSLKTPSNASYMLTNRVQTAFGIVRVDCGWFRKGPKLADFDKKPGL